MPVEARCKKCSHVCAADNICQFAIDYNSDKCEKGGQHDFEPLEEVTPVDNEEDCPFGFGGQIAV